ncbi:methyl-accepting chemotaxis protein [Paenibacillus sabuli]|uniref:methyl-accepting chemotaxis protein n=1 Tax=Paenibacillus sabuli TaxID=2772509 RepID=UPI001CC3110B|nr:methyl-accepting chemotaxis protein [Paenibacillus sabuli]
MTRSVGIKLFVMIFFSILVCVLAVGIFSYNTSKDIIEDKVAQSTEQTIDQSAGKLNIMFQNYEDLTLQLLFDNEIQSQMGVMRKETEAFARFEATKTMESKFQSLIMSNQTIAAGHLIPLLPNYTGISAGGTTLNYETIKEEEWFQQVVEQEGKTLWLPTQSGGFASSGSEKTYGLARLVKSVSTNESVYVLLLEIKYSQLEEQLTGLALGNGGSVRIVDSEGAILYSERDEELGAANGVVLPAEIKTTDPNSFRTKNSEGTQVLAVYKKFNLMDWRLVGEIPVNELVSDAKQIRDITVIAAILAALLAIGIGYLVLRTIAVPLMRLRNLMNEGERGNLAVRSNIRRSDEIGQLANSFNQMMGQITILVNQTNQSAQLVLGTAGELTEASGKTAVAAKEIAVATEEIATGATSLAMEAEKGADLTANIATQMGSVKASSGQMVTSAGEVEQASQRGTEYMSVLIEKTGMTEEMTRSMVEKVDKLKESTGSIRKILEVLNNLTKQTNILSLNATIEAARAGAAGKGFMVVADEIRKLADQSRQSIDVVGQITESIQREIDETVGVLSEAYPIFQEQIESVKEANQLFYSVRNQMTQFVNHLGSVTDSITQLDQSQSVLSEAMENVSGVAEESSATSEEVASLSNEQLNISDGLVRLSSKLEEVSQELRNSLSRFTT